MSHDATTNCSGWWIFGPGSINRGADIAFLVDSSTSVTSENWQKLLDFLVLMTATLRIDGDVHRMGIVNDGVLLSLSHFASVRVRTMHGKTYRHL